MRHPVSPLVSCALALLLAGCVSAPRVDAGSPHAASETPPASDTVSQTPAASETPAASGLLPVPVQGVRVHSEFSHIVVREVGTVRTLYFVGEDGREHIESQMDVARPEQLLLPYARAMFASYLFVPEPQRVLLIGIGAGSMIRFLEHYDARVDVDGVDIDPVVVDVARDYFGTRPSAHVRLLVRDGFDHIETTEERYDVIYLDAFLKPVPDARAVDTDASGVPRRLKTIETYRKMQNKLAPGGVVVVNLHYKTLDEDVETLREAFAQEALFEVPGTGNYVLVGSGEATLPSREALHAVGARVDQRLGADFSIAELSSQLRAE